MKATELRINNYVKLVFPDGEITTIVEGIKRDSIALCVDGRIGWYESKDIEPIPLTEQWLLDFGFVKKHVDFRTQSNPTAYNGGILKLNDFTVYLDKSEIEWAYRATVLDAPKYAHQVQNLFFALTQEELILK